jgi:DNA-binding transcriptional LysR family regulator
MLNHHYIELFYYVAREGGIANAVRKMPYGIQAPAISMQMTELEKSLGVTLFERRPFRLTPDGEELFRFARTYFDHVESVAAQLPGVGTPSLRIGTPDSVLTEYVPQALGTLRKGRPNLRVSFRAGARAEIETWVRDGEVDAGFTLIDRPPADLAWTNLRTVRLVLLVPTSMAIRSADDFFAQKHIREPLICASPQNAVGRVFQRGLAQKGAWWQTHTELPSSWLVRYLVVRGDGIGVSIDVPRLSRHPAIRVLPLDDFERVTVAALWRESRALHPALEELLPRIASHKHWRDHAQPAIVA